MHDLATPRWPIPAARARPSRPDDNQGPMRQGKTWYQPFPSLYGPCLGEPRSPSGDPSDSQERWYCTLMMSTGLTFGTISALFGLSHGSSRGRSDPIGFAQRCPGAPDNDMPRDDPRTGPVDQVKALDTHAIM